MNFAERQKGGGRTEAEEEEEERGKGGEGSSLSAVFRKREGLPAAPDRPLLRARVPRWR